MSNMTHIHHIQILWSLLSTFVAVISAFSFFQPSWITDDESFIRFGMFQYCHRTIDARRLQAYQECKLFGGSKLDFNAYPSKAWQASCIMYGGGSAVLCVAGLLAVITMIISFTSGCDRKLTVYVGWAQLVAVLLMISGQVVYPFGLDSKLVRTHCGNTGMFNAGDCHFAWSYMLAITSTALAIFCPFLAQYTDMNKRGDADIFV